MHITFFHKNAITIDFRNRRKALARQTGQEKNFIM